MNPNSPCIEIYFPPSIGKNESRNPKINLESVTLTVLWDLNPLIEGEAVNPTS